MTISIAYYYAGVVVVVVNLKVIGLGPGFLPPQLYKIVATTPIPFGFLSAPFSNCLCYVYRYIKGI
jgi:hypothetical protein